VRGGRARSSRSRTQGEAFGGAKGEPEDVDPAQISRVIRVHGVGESTIYGTVVVVAAVGEATTVVGDVVGVVVVVVVVVGVVVAVVVLVVAGGVIR